MFERLSVYAIAVTLAASSFVYGTMGDAEVTSNGGEVAKSSPTVTSSTVTGTTDGANSSENSAADATPQRANQVETLRQEQLLLHQMGEAIRRTRRPIVDMVNECMRPLIPMSGAIAGDIDIREGDVIPETPVLAEFKGKFAPPRKKYMKLHMDHFAMMVPFLQSEIDELVIPEAERSIAVQPLEDINGYMGDIEQHLKTLKSLIKAGGFNQTSVVNEARGVDVSLKAIDEARKKLIHADVTIEKRDEKLDRKDKMK